MPCSMLLKQRSIVWCDTPHGHVITVAVVSKVAELELELGIISKKRTWRPMSLIWLPIVLPDVTLACNRLSCPRASS